MPQRCTSEGEWAGVGAGDKKRYMRQQNAGGMGTAANAGQNGDGQQEEDGVMERLRWKQRAPLFSSLL